MRQYFAGVKAFIFLFLKRDRWFMLLWIFLPILILIGHAFTFVSLTQGRELVTVIAEFNQDALIGAVHGPILSTDLVGATLWRSISFITLIMGMGAIFTVIKHTRMDEETGRTEFIHSLVVGKYANITAAFFVAIISIVFSSLLVSVGMVVLGSSLYEAAVFYLTLLFAGIFYTGMGLIACQLKNTSLGARNISLLFLGGSLLLNILNNFGGSNLFIKWLSPISWTRITEPFSNTNILGLLLIALLSVFLNGLAYYLSSKRDIGRAFFTEQIGSANAKSSLRTPTALAWRLHRGLFYGWCMVIILYITAFSAVSPTISGEINSLFKELAGQNWLDKIPVNLLFISIGIYIMSLFISLYALLIMTSLKKEEIAGRNEMILDKKTSKNKYMFSLIWLALIESAGLLILMGVVGAGIYCLVVGQWDGAFLQICLMSISKIPAVWLIIGIFSFLYGYFPKLTLLCWFVWGLFSALEVAWEGNLIDWSIMQFSPFAPVHYTIPMEDISILGLIMLVVLTMILIVIGVRGYQKRDVQTKA
ncbi:ABC transporter permease [Candidatus Enterococcus willemsii]|uniref:ABC transporter permease n=1 Tax=Candidatus Enterococcus willemsii TaxID=1857215 RepID=A0ABQ6Z0Z6_9ENTE|nr:hypothetical protein [Enterococcus sp. CU12B]KAF1305026.1 hypothetical protein BAU17_12955 [Enterococcus sp. CU12B]